MVTLHEYQERGLNLLNNALEKFNTILVITPTGGGKSVMTARFVKSYNKKTIIITHRQEILKHLSLALAADNVEHRIEANKDIVNFIINAHIAKFNKHFIRFNSIVRLSMIDTMNSKKYDQTFIKDASLWIVDEAHHILKNNKWGKIISLVPKDAKGVGFTANSVRGDGKGLGINSHGVFEHLITVISMSELLEK